LAEQVGRPVSVAWTSWMLGFAHYQRNELSQAETYFSEVVHYPHEAHTRTVIDSWAGLCLSLQAQHKHDEACRQAGQLRSFLLEGGQVELMPIADALTAHLELLAGQSAHISDSYTQDLPRQLGLDFGLMPLHVWAIGSTRSGMRNQQAAVAAKLLEYRSLLSMDYVPRRVLEVELLEALLHATQGNDKAALGAVRRAVTIAEPGGALRFFVDIGPDLKPYLYELAGQGIAPKFIARILAAFAPEESKMTALEKPVALLPDNGNAALGPDMLSNRELDVLLLLERRLSNKEIAEILFISPRTVKRHTISIYGKLHVDSRRAAVARAKTLGLMPTS
jgi:LuxR family transcriptional regulator, maltose regulon positive regulatory protein